MTVDIILSGKASTPSDLAFNLAIAWRDYRITQEHIGKIQDNSLKKILGSEQEVDSALTIQKNALQKRMLIYQRLTSLERQQVPSKWQRECDNIIISFQREQELEKMRTTFNQERSR